MNSINCEALPAELYKEIYSHLPLNNHRIIFSSVCKSWKIIYLNDKKNMIKKYFCFDDIKQINNLFKIIEDNNFIYKMIQNKNCFNPKSETIYPDQISLKCDSSFSIGWKPKTLKIKKYSRSVIGADYVIRLHLNYNRINSHFSPEATLTLEDFQTLKDKVFKYKIISDKAMTHLLRHALDYSLFDYIKNVAESNLTYFLTTNNPNDFTIKKFFSCNSLGNISEFNPIKKYNYYFSIREKTTLEGNNFLSWSTNELKSSIIEWVEWSHSYQEILRWCVLSKTVEKITDCLEFKQ